MDADLSDAPRKPAHAIAGEGLVVFIALVLLAGAIMADRSWFDRHILPNFFVSRATMVTAETLARAALGFASAVTFLFLRPYVGRLMVSETPVSLLAAALRLMLALFLGLAVGEGELAFLDWRAAGDAPSPRDNSFRLDERLGWTFSRDRSYRIMAGRRNVEYDFDRFGYRVRDRSLPVDTSRPTVLFSGESIMAGYGLSWDESIPAQVGALMRRQTANVAVFGYSSDQAFLRLAQELPRFRQPLAVVSLFAPGLFFRDFDDDRPHLGPDLAWQPARNGLKLAALARFVVPYHSEAEIGRRIALARATLRCTAELARTRHAAALVVVPHFGPTDPLEQDLRHRILDDSGVPYVWVELDPRWRLPGDVHPDGRAARVIATAIATRLASLVPGRGPTETAANPSWCKPAPSRNVLRE